MNTEAAARPFQVGDPVKITDFDVMTGETIRTHTGKIRSLRDMTASNASDWVTCIAEVDEPYLMGKSDTLHTVTIVHLIPDRTSSTWPSNQTIELLEPAPVPSDDSTPTPFDLDNFVDAVTGVPVAQVLADAGAAPDHGPLAATLSDRTLAKVLSRPAYVPAGAEPEPFSVEGMVITSGWLAEQVGECTCGGVDQYGHECHEPGCGLEPVARLDDLPGWPRTSRPTTDEAVAAIKKRLQWASIHWGTQKVSEDAWPHIADAVLSLWGPEKAS